MEAFIVFFAGFMLGMLVKGWLVAGHIAFLQRTLDSVKKHRDYLLSEIDILEEDLNG